MVLYVFTPLSIESFHGELKSACGFMHNQPFTVKWVDDEGWFCWKLAFWILSGVGLWALVGSLQVCMHRHIVFLCTSCTFPHLLFCCSWDCFSAVTVTLQLNISVRPGIYYEYIWCTFFNTHNKQACLQVIRAQFRRNGSWMKLWGCTPWTATLKLSCTVCTDLLSGRLHAGE